MFKKTSFLKGCKDKVSSNRSVEWGSFRLLYCLPLSTKQAASLS